MVVFAVDKYCCIIGHLTRTTEGFKFVELVIAGAPRTRLGATLEEALPDWAKDATFLEARDLLHAHDLLQRKVKDQHHAAAGSVK
jgi:hypothetical protein